MESELKDMRTDVWLFQKAFERATAEMRAVQTQD